MKLGSIWNQIGNFFRIIYISELSPLHNLLTCGSQSTNGVIKVVKVEQDDSINGVVACRVFATLEGHTGSVQSVSWNPHVNGQLISASTDTTVQVSLNRLVVFILTFLQCTMYVNSSVGKFGDRRTNRL